MRIIDKLIQEKKEEIEKLNRELRKVNLQSFVRESNTSTKVTVLPETDPSRKSKLAETKQNETSSGVWV
jgi:aspartate aminotransferase-like enzyme